MTQWIVAFLILIICGCASPPIRPPRDIRKAFDRIDAIEVGDVTITDSKILRRLQAIYSRSKWDPVPTTLPIDMISFYAVENGQRKFKLVYGAGWLMDTDTDGKIVRLGTLNAEDCDWIEENIRSRLPPNPNIL